MMKKLFFLALSLLLLCGLLAACGEKEPTPNPVSDFKYEENAEGGITITGMTRAVMSSDKEKVVIPSEIEDKKVTKIADSAFSYANIASVYIPDTVLSIGENAFYKCLLLNEVKLSNTLNSLGRNAFACCSKLTQITLPASLTEISEQAFMESGISSVTFQEGIKIIGAFAFYGTALISIDIPSSVHTVKGFAFGDCFHLESITLHDGLVTVEEAAFGGRGATTPCNKVREIIIPKTVTNITRDAFLGDTLLTSVKFEGNAPAAYQTDTARDEYVKENYTVYYHQGATGFTSPTWCGYPTAIW